MITEAVLYFAAPEDASAALLAIGRRPLAFRMLMAAVRAGCDRVRVPTLFRGSVVERAIAGTPSARAAARWLDEATPPPDGPVLLLPAAALVPVAALRPMLAGPSDTVLDPSPSGDAPVVAASPRLLKALWEPLAAGRPLGAALQQTLDGIRRATPAASGYVRVTSRQAATDAEARLWAGLGSPIDTRLDRLVHRRLSGPLSRLAVRWSIPPNAVTLGSLVVGLGAVWGFSHTAPLAAGLGLLLYLVAVVLDHVDGEVARITLTESRLGEWLDVAVDTLIHAALVAALGVTTQRVAGGGGALLGLIAAVGVVASAVMTKTSPPVARSGVGSMLRALGNRDGFYAMLAGFILALAVRPAALPVLMLVVAAGSHAFWLGRLLYRLMGGRASPGAPVLRAPDR